MIFIFLLTVIAVGLFAFLTFSHLMVWERHWALEKKYLVRSEKSELIYLVGLGKMKPGDELFKKTYEALDVFEEVCGHLSFRHLINALENDSDVFNKEHANELVRLMASSPTDVKDIVRHCYETIGKIVLKNSLTTSFFFYLIRKTFVKIMFYRLPRFVLDSIKRVFKKRWNAISNLIYFEDKMNLRFS